MKKQKIITTCLLGGLSAIALAGIFFSLPKKENTFIPEATEAVSTVATWTDISDSELPESYIHEEVDVAAVDQIEGDKGDRTQISTKDEEGTVISLSPSEPKTVSQKPTKPPVTKDDITNPDKQPEYDDSVPQRHKDEDLKEAGSSNDTSASGNNPTASDDSSGKPHESGTKSKPQSDGKPHKDQVYDPVFGWIDTGSTYQDTVDSDGDINKQIGTMGSD